MEKWYKAREAHRESVWMPRCKVCGGWAAYFLNAYGDDPDSGNYCINCITEDMYEVINRWDGGMKFFTQQKWFNDMSLKEKIKRLKGKTNE